MHNLRQDLRYAARMLLKSPGFTFIAVLTLALGIGANTAIFSVVNAVLVEPLPFREPSHLMLIREVLPMVGTRAIPVPAPDILDYQHENRTFDAMAGYVDRSFELAGNGTPETVRAVRASSELIPMLGVTPELGRSFTAGEDAGSHKVAVISDSLWKRRFGGDRNVPGRSIQLDRSSYTVIGVMPRTFDFPLSVTGKSSSRAEVWVPLSLTKDEREGYADNFNYELLGRVKAGVTPAQAQADVNRVAQTVILSHIPAQYRNMYKLSALLVPLREEVVGNSRILLYVLLGAVTFVLLIGCANVANLLLARATLRRKEIAIRRAVGATSGRIIRQLLVESVLLSGLGAALGLALAVWGTELLFRLIPADIPIVHEIGVNLPVVAFTAGVALLTGILFGLAPAIAAARTNVNEALQETTRTGQGRSQSRLRGIVVAAEVALAVVLLAGAGLLLRSFERLRHTSGGFDPENVITASLRLPQTQYHTPDQLRAFNKQLIERLSRIPGSVSVSVSTDLPLSGSNWLRLFTPEGYVPPPGAPVNLDAHTEFAGDYFRTMGIPLLSGRTFTAEEREHFARQEQAWISPVVIISEDIARRFWPNRDPIGKRLKWGPPESSDPWLTVIGVVGNIKQGKMDAATIPHTYQPFAGEFDAMSIALRSHGDPNQLAETLRQAVWQLDSQLAVTHVRTMREVMVESSAQRRATMLLLLAFAGTAMLLAAIGIYGVIAQSVAQRTREIGIRVTLGATQTDILAMVLRGGLGLCLVGVATGIAGALAITRIIRTMLFEVKPWDPLTFAGTAMLLLAVAALACYLPARRATHIDPMRALRYE